VKTYWWASGRMGHGMPAISPIAGPQNPAQETTMSAGTVPSDVVTPVTRPLARSMPVTVVSAQ
jgi:hypothetical protein